MAPNRARFSTHTVLLLAKRLVIRQWIRPGSAAHFASGATGRRVFWKEAGLWPDTGD